EGNQGRGKSTCRGYLADWRSRSVACWQSPGEFQKSAPRKFHTFPPAKRSPHTPLVRPPCPRSDCREPCKHPSRLLGSGGGSAAVSAGERAVLAIRKSLKPSRWAHRSTHSPRRRRPTARPLKWSSTRPILLKAPAS